MLVGIVVSIDDVSGLCVSSSGVVPSSSISSQNTVEKMLFHKTPGSFEEQNMSEFFAQDAASASSNHAASASSATAPPASTAQQEEERRFSPTVRRMQSAQVLGPQNAGGFLRDRLCC